MRLPFSRGLKQRLATLETCPKCDGVGFKVRVGVIARGGFSGATLYGTIKKDCPMCNGLGKVPLSDIVDAMAEILTK